MNISTRPVINLRTKQTGFQEFMDKFNNEKVLHLMILPAVLLTITMAYFPMYGIIIAFKRYDVFKGILKSSWASSYGFEHYIDFLNSPSFGQVLTNTVFIALLKLLLLSFPPVIFAMLLNEVKNIHFKKITQTVSYLPHFISWVVVGGMVYNILSHDGPVNSLMLNLGLFTEPFDYMGSTKIFWPLLIITDFWKEIGWGSIIYLAVITSIDQSLYEAIEIDGGGRLAKALYITWPSLKGTFMVLFILACGSIMSGAGSTFEQCYVMGNPLNRDASDILDTYILRLGLENARYSFSTAVGLFKSVINLALLLGANKLSSILTEKSLF